MKKIISFDLFAEKGFFKKPDINEKICLTYNMLHKPALLGILGAILGLKGFQKNGELPEYYQKLKHIPVGIEPISGNHYNGNFTKTIITYNNSTGLASKEAGGNLVVSEQTLINPAFRIYLLLNLEVELEFELLDKIKNQKAEFLPYLGKNDYSAWWSKESFKEYEVKPFGANQSVKILNIFLKQQSTIEMESVEENKDYFLMDFESKEIGTFSYFEKLPIDYDEKLFQYNLGDFAFTDIKLRITGEKSNLYEIEEGVIQLN